MKTYPKQRIGSRAYIGESMVKILICDDDPTFAQSMFKGYYHCQPIPANP